MTDTSEIAATSAPDSIWKWRGWADVGILLAVVPITAAAVRVLAFAGGDPVVLRSLVQSLDVMTVVLGTLLPLLPGLLWILLMVMLVDESSMTKQAFGTGRRRNVMIVLTIVGALLVALTGPWSQTVGILIGIGALAVTGFALIVALVIVGRVRRSRRRNSSGEPAQPINAQKVEMRSRSRSTWMSRTAWLGPVVVVLVAILLPLGMWLPTEQIEVSNGDTIVGYVLQTTSDWTTIMSTNKTVSIYATQDITHRMICDQGEYESLATIIAGQPQKSADCG